MFATLSALKDAITADCIRAGDADFLGKLATFIAKAEARIFEGVNPLKCREMETRATLTVTAGVTATPADFLGARRMTWEASRPYGLIYRQPENFYEHKNAYSQPAIFTIDGTIIDILSPATGAATLSYYARPAPLTNDIAGNTVLLAHGHIYLFASLIEAYSFLRNDGKVAENIQLFNAAVEGANMAAIKARYSGTHLAPRVPGAV